MPKILLENNITFEKHKTFEWLRNKNPLHLDFYIPKINLAIECQGEQHYKSIKSWGGEIALAKRKELDNLKLELCKENNIELFYFTNYSKVKNEKTFLSSNELLKKIWLLTDKFYEGMNEDEEKSKKF